VPVGFEDVKLPRRFAFAAPALVAILLAVAWSVLSRMPAAPSAASPTAATKAPTFGEVSADNEQRALVTRAEGPVPARAFLAEYWGVDWARIEATMLEQGLDLDVPYHFRPWEEVAEGFKSLFEFSDEKIESRREQKVGWPLTLTPEWILQEYPMAAKEGRTIGPREIAEIEDLTSEVNARLYENFDRWTSGMSRAMEDAWNQGAFVKAPFATYGVPPLKEGHAFYAGARSGNGWSVRLQLFREDHPDLMDLARDMARMRQERELAVKDYLKSL
jgi:hypothetical protein